MIDSKGSVAAKLREHQSLKHLLDIHYNVIVCHLPVWAQETS